MTLDGTGIPERIALALALSLFFGFAFQEFYRGDPRRPGGVRTFPLLAMAGAGLYLIDPHTVAPFIAGLLVLGSWIYAYVRRELRSDDPSEGPFVVPVCGVLAYVLGPLCLTQPLWLCVTVAVVAVLLLGWKQTLHAWAESVPGEEIITAGKFLILVGVVLPLLAGRPSIPFTTITPFGVWLAVVAISSISYGSYLLQHYVFPKGGTLVSSILGGLYSSTATTVVLSQRSREEGFTPEIEAGIVAATAMMYPRIVVVCAIFSRALAAELLVPFLIMGALAMLYAVVRARSGGTTSRLPTSPNPLQIPTALIFAALIVVISVVTAYVQRALGSAGVYALAFVVGVTDIDPFVLGLAQGGVATIGLSTAAMAIAIATSSNNILKAIYAFAFSRQRQSIRASIALGVFAVAGVGLSLLFIR